MSAWLLDINVLIARQDANHEHHKLVSRWLHENSNKGWATCPITENGFVRILGHPSYPGWPGTPVLSALALRELISSIPGHEFISDEISIADERIFKSLKETKSRDVTDLYLLALAVQDNCRFATLNERINSKAINGGKAAYFVIR